MKKSSNNRVEQEQEQDQQDFEIMLSRQDYDKMKSYQGKCDRIQMRMNEKLAEWEKERTQLLDQIKILKEQKKQLWTECQGIKITVDGEYKHFMQMISELRTSCGLSMIKQQGGSLKEQIQYLAEMLVDTDSSNKTDKNSKNIHKKSISIYLSMLQKTLCHMTQTVSTIISPIQSLISGTKLTQQALNLQNIRCQHQLQKLQCYLKQLQTEKLMSQKKHQKQKNLLQTQIRKQFISNINNLQADIIQLRQQNIQLIKKLAWQENSRLNIENQHDLIFQQNFQLNKEIKQLQQQNYQYQQHIKILKQSIQIQSRSKMNNQNSKTKSRNEQKVTQGKSIDNNNGSSSPSKKFQKQSYIKETLIQYSREIKNNLISIGNLSQDQIKQIGVSQLKTLIKFIHQLEEDFQ